MKRIVCFGEVLIDFLNTSSSSEGKIPFNNFTQYPGGAPANVAVAIAKLGGQSAFAGQVGDDAFGHFLLGALRAYDVDTSLTSIHSTAKTAIAFVFLNEDGERSFTFHRDGTADVVLTEEQIGSDWFSAECILHFCSNTLTDYDIAEVTRAVVNKAKDNDTIVSFDVNLRHNLWKEGCAKIDIITELVHLSDMVKFEAEEINFLSEGRKEEYISNCFSAGVQVALITAGGDVIECRTPTVCFEVKPPKVHAVDTTGGGDAFIGAILYDLSCQSDPKDYLQDHASLKETIEFAAQCGAHAVTHPGAFPAFPTMDNIRNSSAG